MRRHLLSGLVTIAAVSTLVIACGGSSDEDVTPTDTGALAEEVTPALQGGADSPDSRVPGSHLIIELTARDISFNETELQAPAFAQVSVIVENDDEDTAHGFSLYRTPNGGEPVFIGGLVPPQQTRTFTFTTPEPGTYYFRDDLMPGLLNGTLETR